MFEKNFEMAKPLGSKIIDIIQSAITSSSSSNKTNDQESLEDIEELFRSLFDPSSLSFLFKN